MIRPYYCGDCLKIMRSLPEKSVDLIFGSPPYEDARTYGIDFRLKGQSWVDWMVKVYLESLRICRGLVAFVVQGRTRKFSWSGTPALLMADLLRRGVTLRDCLFYHRSGIPGSGGPDWLRHDVDYIVCATNGGRLPWSDNTVMGHPPKWAPGGEMSYRVSNGSRVNQWGHPFRSGATTVRGDGVVRSHGRRPSHIEMTKRRHAERLANEDIEAQSYIPPVKANPGNVIFCKVGGGQMGSKLAHENEAPFPETLTEFFIRSFCPPSGLVLDPFAGSGTVGAVAVLTGRRFSLIDVRPSQIIICKKRILETKSRLRRAHHGAQSVK